MIAARTIIDILLLYCTLGFIFAIVFVAAGLERVDSHAKGAGIGFRLMILPGASLLWPFLLVRWLRGSSGSRTGWPAPRPGATCARNSRT